MLVEAWVICKIGEMRIWNIRDQFSGFQSDNGRRENGSFTSINDQRLAVT